MPRVVHRLRLGLDDLIAAELIALPFELGTRDESVEVTLDYPAGEDAVIDLGCEGAAGWRGWSGGVRTGFVIRRDRATPGYLPGELEPGEWAVQLGLYRLPVEPIEVTVTVTIPAESEIPDESPGEARPEAPRASLRALPAPTGLRWYAGDFHAHSTHSDGEQSLGELAALAVGNGLDFLAVTEHNTVSHHPELARHGARHGITLLPGQEVTTRRGHANAFGDIGFVDFREHPDHWLAQTAVRGGILSVNHPLDGEWAWQHPLAAPFPALELWHIGWFRDLTSTAPWAFWSGWRPDTILLGGSDYHHPRHGYPPGTPVTWVAAESRDTEAILDAVAAGHTAITRLPTPDSPALVRVDGELVAVDADGAVLCDIEGRRRRIHDDRVAIPEGDAGRGPFRLETPDRTLLAVSP